MTLLKSLVSCTRTLARYKLRTFSMLLGSWIGVTALTLVFALGKGAERKVLHTIGQFFSPCTILLTNGAGMVMVGQREQGARLTLDDLEAVARAEPKIELWDPLIVASTLQVRHESRSTTVRVVGGSERGERAWNRGVTDGEYFDATAVTHTARVALIGSTVARELLGPVESVGAEILVGSVPFRVVGTLEPLGIDAHGLDRDNEIVVPYTTMMRRVLNVDALSGAKILTRAPEDTSEVATRIRQVLRERHGLSDAMLDDFSLKTPTDVNRYFAQGKRVLFVFVPLASGICLLAGAIVTAALMLLSVNQRTAEIGLRRAVGATPRQIALQFAGEATLTSALGGSLGVALGVLGAQIIARRMALPDVQTWQPALLGLGVSCVFGLLASLLPARRAARLDPVQALR